MAGSRMAGHMGRIGEIEWKCRAGALPVKKRNNRGGKKSPGWLNHERFLWAGLCRGREDASSLLWNCLSIILPHILAVIQSSGMLSDCCHLPALSCSLVPWGRGWEVRWEQVGHFLTLGWALRLLAVSRFCSLGNDELRKGNYPLRSPASSLISRGRDKDQI